jgi:hypothetical protein
MRAIAALEPRQHKRAIAPLPTSGSKKKEEADISRVLFSHWQASRGQLSIWDACHQAPLADWQAQHTPHLGAGKRPTVAPSTLLPTGVYRASASRRCWCALTAPLHPYPEFGWWIWDFGFESKIANRQSKIAWAVCFCGTILTLTRTWRYQAGLVFREPGLSSDAARATLRNSKASAAAIASSSRSPV